MPFGNPSQTPYDLQFSLFGFPIRIHPFFWVACLLLSGSREPLHVLLWTIAVLVSILIHELGHALLQRRFGGQPYIVLYGFGGLAYGNGADQSPRSSILISLAGPFAGFLFGGLIAGGIALTGRQLWVESGVVLFEAFDSPVANRLLFDLLYINVWWGLLNLLPIYPLDGGHVARESAMLSMTPHRAIVLTLWMSILFAAGAAAFAFQTRGISFMLLLFGMLAYNNYQTLEAFRNSRGGGW